MGKRQQSKGIRCYIERFRSQPSFFFIPIRQQKSTIKNGIFADVTSRGSLGSGSWLFFRKTLVRRTFGRPTESGRIQPIGGALRTSFLIFQHVLLKKYQSPPGPAGVPTLQSVVIIKQGPVCSQEKWTQKAPVFYAIKNAHNEFYNFSFHNILPTFISS